ncbi:lytic polysaccharide monooxygenase [Silvanigrella aquatica]|uniref:Chitin-binding type-3 domain-containing protein n=1 Tax=Silvanigrella aquatica TaxID=1915309 RepID=A0A1L4D0J1_9BACT|nr:lytic polysaccharide monooxygenase [Silvanigrella aquatica]APJ03715.1 hypothetical protein AXG55_07265 [Silvanigrella aquatica]
MKPYVNKIVIFLNSLSLIFLSIKNVSAQENILSWNENTTYTSGQKVVYQDKIYEAKWWTRGNPPSKCDTGDAWKPILKENELLEWDSNCTYVANNIVTFNSENYRAKWWTRGNSPLNGNPWQKIQNIESKDKVENYKNIIPNQNSKVPQKNQINKSAVGRLKININGDFLPENISLTLKLNNLSYKVFHNQEISNLPIKNYNQISVDSFIEQGVTYIAEVEEKSIFISEKSTTQINIKIKKEVALFGSLNVNVTGEQLPHGKSLILNLGKGLTKMVSSGTQDFIQIPVGKYSNIFLMSIVDNGYVYAAVPELNELEVKENKVTNMNLKVTKVKHEGVIPDSQLCSAGRKKYSGLDLPRTDWVATDISPNAEGKLDFTYLAAAPHATKYFEFYITKDSYNPSLPLKWSDLEDKPFCVINSVKLENKRYKMSCPYPKGKPGKKVIYNIWQRSDSPEAFYACIDVNLK